MEEKTTYRWLHPEIIRWERQGESPDSGYAFRRWTYLNLSFDHFTINRSVNFFRTDADEIASSYNIEKVLADYEALSDAEKKALISKEHQFDSVVENTNPDGFAFEATGEFKESDTIMCLHVDNFEGKDAKPWFVPTPRRLKRVSVSLVPFSRQHGGMYRRGDDSVVRIQVSVDSNVIEGILRDLNASSERKRIELSFQARLFDFTDFSDVGPMDDYSPGQYLLMPYNQTSVPVILDSIQVVLYERSSGT
ncbi:hypothetical protein [Sinorhizobium meliloti]|uniref:hypothetical protein n=1 Tax=Rhizobium meliloti TaxID=382 RepID=UPI0012975DE7|nr:hypothetical protein [Sinorhizobium meliloti]MQU83078.1 hypothetical protein [Sinorhizobium meliloti]MQU86276.1 hypothetical protein [Sinorhizobium meliloti]